MSEQQATQPTTLLDQLSKLQGYGSVRFICLSKKKWAKGRVGYSTTANPVPVPSSCGTSMVLLPIRPTGVQVTTIARTPINIACTELDHSNFDAMEEYKYFDGKATKDFLVSIEELTELLKKDSLSEDTAVYTNPAFQVA